MFGMTVMICVVAILATLGFSYRNYRCGRKLPSGDKEVLRIRDAIKEGANAFLKREFKVSVPVMIGAAVIFTIIFHPYVGLAFLIGATVSSLSGIIGMAGAVIFNEKVTTAAKAAVEQGLSKDKAETKAGKVAITGGAIMGFGVKGFVLLGLLIVFTVIGQVLSFANPANLVMQVSFVGIEFVMFPQALSCFALGCSTVAIFNRLGGGIFTKGADMGADLVGKTEEGMEEDDPNNPAVIADCVGDNVGDVAGNGSDLNESTAGAIVSAMVLATMLFLTSLKGSNPISGQLFSGMLMYPLAFAGVGAIACFVGVFFVLKKKSKSVAKDLNLSLWGSAAIIAVATLFLSWFFFGGQDGASAGFRVGWVSPWIGAIVGIGAGVLMGILAERYTSDRFPETKKIAEFAKQGPALTAVGGIGLGWRSALPYGVVFGLAIVISNLASGLYGVAMAAVGMLSFVAATVTVDTYGPIADNAGGISEMTKMPDGVRRVTDSLDSLGNTTAAVGKGFAIGSGVLAALSMMVSFTESGNVALDITDPLMLAGAFIGAAVMYWLSGKMMNAVCKNAAAMVEEVRRQMPDILSGAKKPDYAKCVDICTKHALGEMRVPVFVSLLTPLVGGLIGGPVLVGGIITGTILVSMVMAVATANSGGAWDNAKKMIKATRDELTAVYGEAKWKDMHNAAVVGDTIGDPFKDVVGPNQDIMIKLMSTMSLVMLPVFAGFNLLGWVLSLFF
jgi:K(+)-stimulated pyrophosphate-energized sodium pump